MTKATETRLGLVTCGKDYNTLHIGTVEVEITDAGQPWARTHAISATANCAGRRHVSCKYRWDLQGATCPRCRAAYLNEKAAQVETPAIVTAAPATSIDRDAIATGDYLTLAYGNGTQTAYVSAVAGRRLHIYRLVGHTGKWTGPRPMNRDDGRILGRVASLEGASAPAIGFIPAR